MSVKTIVVGYDGRDEASHALDRAIEYAKAFGAQLVVVTVGEVVAYVPPYGADTIAGLPPAIEDPAVTLVAEDVAGGVLAGARDRVGDVPADFLTRVGSPDGALIAVAEERGAELIVVGTREPGFLDRLLEGSVSRDVVKRAHCDVLVVHPKHKG